MHHQGTTIIEIHGAAEDDDEAAFREILFQTIQNATLDSRRESINNSATDIALDLSNVAFVSEEAVAVLIHALKAQKAREALLRLVHSSPWVRKKLERTALLPFFPIEDI